MVDLEARPAAPPAAAALQLTKYERTKVIGIRAEQLRHGSAPFVDPGDPSDPSDPYEIAERELLTRRLPFILWRRMPDGTKVPLRLADTVAASK